MNYFRSIAFLLILIGGMLSIIPVLPVIDNFFPIFLLKININQNRLGISNLSFSGTITITGPISGGGLFTEENFGWTPLGFSPQIMIIFFVSLGCFAIFLSICMISKFFSSNKVKNIPILGLAGIFNGIIVLFFDLLIFLGDPLVNSKSGLSLPSMPANLSYYYSIQYILIIGSGYWFLVLSGLLIFSGGLIYVIAINRILINKKTVNKSFSNQIDRYLDKIEEIIQETSNSKKEY